MPHQTVDPIPVACELVGAWQVMITRRVPAFDPAVITVGSINGGTTHNVVPDSVTLKLTVRAASPRVVGDGRGGPGAGGPSCSCRPSLLRRSENRRSWLPGHRQ